MILLLDGNNLCYRADQTHQLTTKQGERVGAIYGTINMIHSYLKPSGGGYNNYIYDALEEIGVEENFTRVVMAFDGGKSKWRKSFYSEYKAQRDRNRAQKTPEEKAARDAFLGQMNTLHEELPNFGVKSLKLRDWEADDLIYTVTKLSRGERVIVVSTDKDMLQLVSDTVYVWRPSKDKDGKLYTPENFEKLTGVAKESYLDYRLLVGDSSDNIPGITGIGEKTAASLMKEYKSIEGMIPYRALLMKSKVKQRIFTNADILDRNDALMNMERIPMESVEPYVKAELVTTESFDEKAVKTFLMKKQFVSILKNMLQLSQAFKQLS